MATLRSFVCVCLCVCVCNETVCVLIVVFVLKSIHVTSFHITILLAQCVHMCIHTHRSTCKTWEISVKVCCWVNILSWCKFPYVDSILWLCKKLSLRKFKGQVHGESLHYFSKPLWLLNFFKVQSLLKILTHNWQRC